MRIKAGNNSIKKINKVVLKLIILMLLPIGLSLNVKVSGADANMLSEADYRQGVVSDLIDSIKAKAAERISTEYSEILDSVEKSRAKVFERYGPKHIEDTFYYASGDFYDFKTGFDFDDACFMTPASEYDGSLAEMSLCLAMSAFRSNTAGSPEKQSRNAADLLEKTGFKGIETNDWFKKIPEADSFGVIAGYKNVIMPAGKYSLIVLTTRGAGYQAEWASNLMLGPEGRHKGFGMAAEIVEDFLKEYIASHEDELLPHVKLWMAGYSRGGAAVNLAAGDITLAGGIGGCGLEMDDIYVYCFEAPQGESTDAVSPEEAASLHNIHNVGNPDDAIPRVAFEKWGFIRYGVDENTIPEYDKNLHAKLKDIYKNLRTTETVKSFVKVENEGTETLEYLPDTFVARKLNMDINFDTEFEMVETEFIGIPMKVPKLKLNSFNIQALEEDDKSFSQFLDEVVDALATGFESREVYYEYMEPVICRLVSELFSEENRKADWDKVLEILSKRLKENILEVAKLVFLQDTDSLADLLTDYFFEAADEAGIHITRDDSVRDGTSQMVSCVFETALYSLLNGNIGNIITLVENFDLIANNHYPELCLSWMRYSLAETGA